MKGTTREVLKFEQFDEFVVSLAEHYTVVVPDLRGYERSAKPQSDPLHLAYSKRTMARDQVLLMEHFGNQLGFEKFAVCAHDRGARVAHRLLVDYPELVTQAMLLDIAPTLDMYESTHKHLPRRTFIGSSSSSPSLSLKH